MRTPVAFSTPTPRIPYRRIESWLQHCTSAPIDAGQGILPQLLDMVICSNQISLILSLAGAAPRAKKVLDNTLAIVKPYIHSNDAMRLATASVHQNLARLAVGAGDIETISAHIDRMHVGSGFGEDEIHRNFIAWCNAHFVATYGTDAPYFSRYRDRCISDYTRTIRQEAEVIFKMREQNWVGASNLISQDISSVWDRNLMWQVYSICVCWAQHHDVPSHNEITYMLDEVELFSFEPAVKEISIVKLLLRICALAQFAGKAPFERAVDITERIGRHFDDYYLIQVTSKARDTHADSPYWFEAAYKEILRSDAEKVVTHSTEYEKKLVVALNTRRWIRGRS